MLTRHGVEYVVVGGMAAALNGAPVNTLDLDVVHVTTPENVARILGALDELGAGYRAQPERRLRPRASHLASPGHRLLITKFGPLDLLGRIGKDLVYADLLRHAEAVEIAADLQVLVLDLETQIRVKEEVGGEKDRAALPLLRRTLAEKRRQ